MTEPVWTRRRGGTAAVLLLAGALALGACTAGRSDVPTSSASAGAASTSAVPSTGPSATQSEVPVPFPANTAPDEQAPSSDAALTLTDVTTGAHEGYDRVVFTFAGPGTPGWMVRSVDVATDDPKDDTLDIAGDGTLLVVLQGVTYPAETGPTPWAGPNPILTPR